ncbi:hypothetical protein I4U23_009179 [Adineta vaga]|nr:hypothetical protein I4U23_009179 [Adineta vaga]
MDLMKKIDSDGLGTVIENMKEARFNINSINELTKELVAINNYIQTQSSISIEQIQNQLEMTFFIATRDLSEQQIQELIKSTNLYLKTHLSLPENVTKEQSLMLLEHLKLPIIRICLQRILNSVHGKSVDLTKVSNEFYKQTMADLLHELLHGSDEFNQSLLFQQVKEQLKKNKDLSDRIYRQMIKEKLITIDTKIKIDTDKKKLTMITNHVNKILNNKEDRAKQSQLVEILNKTEIILPERIKHWYNYHLILTVYLYPDDSIILDQLPVKSYLIQRENNQQISDIQPTVTTHTVPDLYEEIESRQNVLLDNADPNTSSLVPLIENKQMANVQYDLSSQSVHLIEKDSDMNNETSILTRIEMIQSKNMTHGKVGENQILNFIPEQRAALLLYSAPTIDKYEQDVHISLYGKLPEYINDPQYKKMKAQRILAKAIPSSNVHQQTEDNTNATSSSSSSNLVISNTEQTISTSSTIPKLLESQNISTDQSSIPIEIPPLDSTKSSVKNLRLTLNKSLKQTENIYITSLTNALRRLFSRSEYDSNKLQKIHEELISSGHISPLNEFYRSSNEALRITLEHCITYQDFIRWTLSLLQTTHKLNLLDFGHDLYSIAIDLDLSFIEHIDEIRCVLEIQGTLKQELQSITENDLREKLLNIQKKLNVTFKDRMLSDLSSLLLHLLQVCHTFPRQKHPMQTYIREIAETFKSRAVADLARHLDDIEKHLAKTFGITFFGVSKRLHESHFNIIK